MSSMQELLGRIKIDNTLKEYMRELASRLKNEPCPACGHKTLYNNGYFECPQCFFSFDPGDWKTEYIMRLIRWSEDKRC